MPFHRVAGTVVLGAAALLMSGSVQAQSMNIPRIVQRVTTEICTPLIQDDDMVAAVSAALEQGYVPIRWSPRGEFDRANPPAMVVMDGSSHHVGLLVLRRDRGGLCSVEMPEAGVARVMGLAQAPLAALGMTLSLDQTGQRPGLAVWSGDGRQAVVGPGAHQRGTALTLSWDHRQPD